MEELGQALKAAKHEKRGCKAKEHFLNTSSDYINCSLCLCRAWKVEHALLEQWVGFRKACAPVHELASNEKVPQKITMLSLVIGVVLA